MQKKQKKSRKINTRIRDQYGAQKRREARTDPLIHYTRRSANTGLTHSQQRLACISFMMLVASGVIATAEVTSSANTQGALPPKQKTKPQAKPNTTAVSTHINPFPEGNPTCPADNALATKKTKKPTSSKTTQAVIKKEARKSHLQKPLPQSSDLKEKARLEKVLAHHKEVGNEKEVTQTFLQAIAEQDTALIRTLTENQLFPNFSRDNLLALHASRPENIRSAAKYAALKQLQEKLKAAESYILGKTAALSEDKWKSLEGYLDIPVGNDVSLLTLATFRNNTDTIETVLKHGANPDIHQPQLMRPSFIAVKNNNLPALILLRNHGADFLKLDTDGSTLAQHASTQDSDLKIFITNEMTAQLKKKGLSLDAQDYQYRAALIHCLNEDHNEEKAIQILIDLTLPSSPAEANKRIATMMTDTSFGEETPMIIAQRRGFTTFIEKCREVKVTPKKTKETKEKKETKETTEATALPPLSDAATFDSSFTTKWIKHIKQSPAQAQQALDVRIKVLQAEKTTAKNKRQLGILLQLLSLTHINVGGNFMIFTQGVSLSGINLKILKHHLSEASYTTSIDKLYYSAMKLATLSMSFPGDKYLRGLTKTRYQRLLTSTGTTLDKLQEGGRKKHARSLNIWLNGGSLSDVIEAQPSLATQKTSRDTVGIFTRLQHSLIYGELSEAKKCLAAMQSIKKNSSSQSNMFDEITAAESKRLIELAKQYIDLFESNAEGTLSEDLRRTVQEKITTDLTGLTGLLAHSESQTDPKEEALTIQRAFYLGNEASTSLFIDTLISHSDPSKLLTDPEQNYQTVMYCANVVLTSNDHEHIVDHAAIGLTVLRVVEANSTLRQTFVRRLVRSSIALKNAALALPYLRQANLPYSDKSWGILLGAALDNSAFKASVTQYFDEGSNLPLAYPLEDQLAHIRDAQFLLGDDAKMLITTRVSGIAILTESIIKNRIDLSGQVLTLGLADPNTASTDSLTNSRDLLPLAIATRDGYLTAAKQLLQHGARPNYTVQIPGDTSNNDDTSAIRIALDRYSKDPSEANKALALLLAHHVEPGWLVHEKRQRFFDHLLEDIYPGNEKIQALLSPINSAAKTIENIMKHQAPMTPAALDTLESQHIDLLVSPGGNTLLHWATEQNQADLVEDLLARGANPDQLNHRGLTPLSSATQLHGAMDGKQPDMLPTIKALVQGGADPLIIDKAGKIFAHHAPDHIKQMSEHSSIFNTAMRYTEEALKKDPRNTNPRLTSQEFDAMVSIRSLLINNQDEEILLDLFDFFKANTSPSVLIKIYSNTNFMPENLLLTIRRKGYRKLLAAYQEFTGENPSSAPPGDTNNEAKPEKVTWNWFYGAAAMTAMLISSYLKSVSIGLATTPQPAVEAEAEEESEEAAETPQKTKKDVVKILKKVLDGLLSSDCKLSEKIPGDNRSIVDEKTKVKLSLNDLNQHYPVGPMTTNINIQDILETLLITIHMAEENNNRFFAKAQMEEKSISFSVSAFSTLTIDDAEKVNKDFKTKKEKETKELPEYKEAMVRKTKAETDKREAERQARLKSETAQKRSAIEKKIRELKQEKTVLIAKANELLVNNRNEHTHKNSEHVNYEGKRQAFESARASLSEATENKSSEDTEIAAGEHEQQIKLLNNAIKTFEQTLKKANEAWKQIEETERRTKQRKVNGPTKKKGSRKPRTEKTPPAQEVPVAVAGENVNAPEAATIPAKTGQGTGKIVETIGYGVAKIEEKKRKEDGKTIDIQQFAELLVSIYTNYHDPEKQHLASAYAIIHIARLLNLKNNGTIRHTIYHLVFESYHKKAMEEAIHRLSNDGELINIESIKRVLSDRYEFYKELTGQEFSDELLLDQKNLDVFFSEIKARIQKAHIELDKTYHDSKSTPVEISAMNMMIILLGDWWNLALVYCLQKITGLTLKTSGAFQKQLGNGSSAEFQQAQNMRNEMLGTNPETAAWLDKCRKNCNTLVHPENQDTPEQYTEFCTHHNKSIQKLLKDMPVALFMEDEPAISSGLATASSSLYGSPQPKLNPATVAFEPDANPAAPG